MPILIGIFYLYTILTAQSWAQLKKGAGNLHSLVEYPNDFSSIATGAAPPLHHRWQSAYIDKRPTYGRHTKNATTHRDN